MTATTMLAIIPRIVRRIQPLRSGRRARALNRPLFLAAALFFAIPVNGLIAAQPECPYTATAAVDGCAGAPTVSALTVLRPDFFSGYAQRNKQRWISGAHPPWNVAGVDYPVGISASAIVTPGSDSYVRSTTGPGYGLKRPINANFSLDGFYGLTNGCSLGANNRILCAGTMSAITFDGYDFSDPETGGAYLYPGQSLISNPKLIIRNSYIAPGINTAKIGWLIRYNANGPITLENNFFDGLGERWEIWNGGAGGGVTSFVFISTPGLDATSLDCGIEASICVQYNAFVNGPPREIAYVAGCATICDSLVWRYNYLEGVSYPAAQFIGTIDNNGAKSPGSCLTISSYMYGAVTPGSIVSAPDIRAMTVTNVPCNGESSFTLKNPSKPVAQYVPSKTMYTTRGIHGDPQFVAVSSHAAKIPTILGPFVHSYSTTLFPENAFGGTGVITWNTTIGLVVRSGSIDNCTPACGMGSAGNTLSVNTISSVGLWPGKIAIGEAIGGNGSVNPQTIITGDANGGAQCDNASCTGTGNTGTYAVSGPPQRASINSNWEFTGVSMTKLQLDHNVLVTNRTNLGENSREAADSGAVLGDNHAMTIDTVNIADNYYDPSGAWFCIDPRYNNSPAGLPPSGNVNLLGDGAGGRDPKENTPLCHGRY